MNLFLKLVEKALTSLLVSFLIIFASFSFMTGRFPPKKEDFRKATVLIKELFFSTQDYNDKAASLRGRPPNLEQLIELQRLGLKRSEVSLSLQKVFARIPQGAPNLKVSQQIDQVSQHLSQAEKGISDINEDLRVLLEGK